MIGDPEVAVPIALACVAFAAFCAGTEVALFSLRRGERDQLARGARRVDRRIAALLARPRPLVTTVLIGHVAAAGTIAVVAFAVLARAWTTWSALALALAIALPLVVLVSEITAKTLAAKAPLAWARLCALPLATFALVIAPVRLVIEAIAAVVLAPLGGGARPRAPGDLSEAEFRTLVDAGSAQGQVDARERRLIHRVFEFHDKNVGQVMTPRERIFALSYDLPAQRLIKEVAARGFSRVPIYQKSLDNVRGVLNAKDLVRTTAGQPLGRPLGELLHEPLFVPRTTPVKRLFLTFKQKKVHMAIVVSEYGKVLGLVTMDDLLAQIFGVLRDERAELQSSVVPQRAPARTPVDGKPIAGEPGAPGAAADDELVHRGDDRSGPAMLPDGTLAAAAVLDPPSVRPIHVVDEVTPPATDLAELLPREPGDPR